MAVLPKARYGPRIPGNPQSVGRLRTERSRSRAMHPSATDARRGDASAAARWLARARLLDACRPRLPLRAVRDTARLSRAPPQRLPAAAGCAISRLVADVAYAVEVCRRVAARRFSFRRSLRCLPRHMAKFR